MTDDDTDPQQLICLFCLPKRDPNPDSDKVHRNCGMCVGRSSNRWCECTFCPWL